MLPPLPPCAGTGLPDAWLDAGSGQYAHHYRANQNTSTCGRYRPREVVRAAWAKKGTILKPHCPSCARRFSIS